MGRVGLEVTESYKKGNGKPEAEPGGSIIELTDEEINARKEWLDLTEVDEEAPAELLATIDQWLENLMEDLYEHFLKFDETRSFFPTEEILSRARAAQTQYFRPGQGRVRSSVC